MSRSVKKNKTTDRKPGQDLNILRYPKRTEEDLPAPPLEVGRVGLIIFILPKKDFLKVTEESSLEITTL